MIKTTDIARPPRELVEALAHIGSATCAGELNRMGIHDPHLRGLDELDAGQVGRWSRADPPVHAEA